MFINENRTYMSQISNLKKKVDTITTKTSDWEQIPSRSGKVSSYKSTARPTVTLASETGGFRQAKENINVRNKGSEKMLRPETERGVGTNEPRLWTNIPRNKGNRIDKCSKNSEGYNSKTNTGLQN